MKNRHAGDRPAGPVPGQQILVGNSDFMSRQGIALPGIGPRTRCSARWTGSWWGCSC
ncbi:MAG: hypothetical protein ACLS43_12880 [Evtepia gabavorous]